MRISDWSSDVCSSDLIVGPSEAIVVSTFHIELDSGGGDLHVTMPYSMIEPIREMLDAGFQSDVSDQDERCVKALREDILDVSVPLGATVVRRQLRSEEHTSELQSLMRISYAVFCLKKKITKQTYKQI